MKKCIVILLCTALGVGSVTGFEKIQKQKTDMNEEALANAINPFTDCDSLVQAEKLAGFSIEIPDQIEGRCERIYRSMNQTLLEIIYTDGSGNEIARIRKEAGNEDISGDYTEYPLCMNVMVGKKLVEMRGEAGKLILAIWQDSDYSYSLSTKGVTVEKMRELVGGIR